MRYSRFFNLKIYHFQNSGLSKIKTSRFLTETRTELDGIYQDLKVFILAQKGLLFVVKQELTF